MNTFNTTNDAGKYVAENIDFSPRLFSEMIKKININDYYMKYDSSNGLIVEHNLPEKEFEVFCKSFKKYIKKGEEFIKERIERVSLYHFLIAAKISDCFIEKTKRPDFIINLDNKIIGVEVTKLTTKKDEIMSKISNLVSGKKLTPIEMKNEAKRKFKYDYNKYEYYSYEGHSAISSGLSDTRFYLEKYVEIIDNKILKYERDANRFDKLLILCDGIESAGISSEEQCKRLIFKSEDSYKGDLFISVLYMNSDHQLLLYEESK